MWQYLVLHSTDKLNRGCRHKMKTKPFKFNKEKVISFLKTEADGYSVFDSKYLIKELGFNHKKINTNIRRHASTMPHFKKNIYSNRELVRGENGIVCLEFLYWLASKLGIATDNPFRTRSFQFKYLAMLILNTLKSRG